MAGMDRREVLGGCAAACVLVPVLVLCVVPVVWSHDLMQDPRVVIGDAGTGVGTDVGVDTADWGPGAAAAWWAGSVGLAGVALGLAAVAGARVRWGSVVLVGAGMAGAMVWLGRGYGAWGTAGGWVAGAALGLAALHVGQLPWGRRWLVGGLVGITVSLAVEAGYDLWVEYPNNVAYWEAFGAQALQAEGVSVDSPEARLRERRTLSRDATGVFGLANVLGTVLAGCTVLAAGWTLQHRPRRAFKADRERESRLGWASWGAAAVGLCITAAGMMAVWGTHSTGSIGALAIGLGVMGVVGVVGAAAWAGRARMQADAMTSGGGTGRGRAWAVTAAVVCVVVGMVVGVVGVVVVRGVVVGPPLAAVGDAGERSLLFRWQYWSGGWRLWWSAAADAWQPWVWGVGPGGFGQGYLVHKSPLSPEEVTSAHNMIVDWVVMLGLSGLAWVGVVGWWLVGGTWGATRVQRFEAIERLDQAKDGEREKSQRWTWGLAAGVSAVVFGVAYAVRLPGLDAVTVWGWLAGGVGLGMVLGLAGQRGRRGAEGGGGVGRGGGGGGGDVWLRAGMVGGATAVVVQGMLDMAWFQGSSAPVVWVMVGLAGSLQTRSGRRHRDNAHEASSVHSTLGGEQAWRVRVLGGWGVALVLMGVSGWMAVAYAGPVSEHVSRVERSATAIRAGDARQALRELDALAQTTGGSTDPAVMRWRVTLRLELMGWLEDQAAMGGTRPADRDASRQAELWQTLWQDAYGAAKQATDALDTAASWRLLATVEAQGGRRGEAVLAWEQAVERSPYSWRTWLELGQARERAGDADGAAQAVERALWIDEQLYLDQGKRMLEQRPVVEAMLERFKRAN